MYKTYDLRHWRRPALDIRRPINKKLSLKLYYHRDLTLFTAVTMHLVCFPKEGIHTSEDSPFSLPNVQYGHDYILQRDIEITAKFAVKFAFFPMKV